MFKIKLFPSLIFQTKITQKPDIYLHIELKTQFADKLYSIMFAVNNPHAKFKFKYKTTKKKKIIACSSLNIYAR